MIERQPQQEPATEQDNKDFWRACATGNMAGAVDLWQTRDVDVDYVRVAPVIFAALRNNHYAVIGFLLEAGADPSVRIAKNWTLLMEAAQTQERGAFIAVLDALKKRFSGQPVRLFTELTVENMDRFSALDYANTMLDSYPAECLSKAIDEAKEICELSTLPGDIMDLLGSITSTEALVNAQNGKSLFRKAVEAGALREALETLERHGGHVSRELLLEHHMVPTLTTLRLIAAQGKLAELFTPERCKGQVGMMRELWQGMESFYHEQMDGNEGRPSIAAVMLQANIHSAKAHQRKAPRREAGNGF